MGCTYSHIYYLTEITGHGMLNSYRILDVSYWMHSSYMAVENIIIYLGVYVCVDVCVDVCVRVCVWRLLSDNDETMDCASC